MSTWDFEEDYKCMGDCNWGACGGHHLTLQIQDTADTYSIRRDGKLQSCGPIEELSILDKMIQKASGHGLL